MDLLEIETVLNSIFSENLNINFKKKPLLKDRNLLGEEIGISPYEMLYIFFAIEEKFGFLFNDFEITQENFFSFNSLLKLIFEKLNNIL